MEHNIPIYADDTDADLRSKASKYINQVYDKIPKSLGITTNSLIKTKNDQINKLVEILIATRDRTV